jgi:PPOX class probable F420-dependent enzyme
MARISDEHARLFLEPNYAVVSTLRPDGSPQQTAVWIDWDGEHVVFNITETRKKFDYLREDPRASVLVFDGDDRYKWISVSGTVVELTTEGAEEHIHRLSNKYRGRDYTLRPGEQRVVARLQPEHVTVYGLE